ncbi:MAG TPA: sugar transferase [Clostridiales bacterium]|nr:sugar transferase [Clostridiales bacterium]
MYKKYIKRGLDLLFCLIALPLLLVVLVAVAIAIKLEDGGPVFYCAARLGMNKKVFKMYKFRSMKVNAPDIRNEDGTTYNAKDDPRITKVGRFIRETSLDELPQILNILKGDMSFIGPRPSLPDMLSMYTPEEMPKLSVRPGITGYCQAYFRNSLPGSEKRLKDAWYAQNITFMLDMKILIRTVLTVIKREGLYTNDQGASGAAKASSNVRSM